jgi:hypothetical protein
MTTGFSLKPITHRGETKPLAQWADDLGLPYATVRMRASRGVTDPAELFRPPRGYFQKAVPTTGKPLRKYDLTLLDDMFPAQTVEQLREIGRQANLSPLQVVQKIVIKKAEELLKDHPKTN